MKAMGPISTLHIPCLTLELRWHMAFQRTQVETEVVSPSLSPSRFRYFRTLLGEDRFFLIVAVVIGIFSGLAVV